MDTARRHPNGPDLARPVMLSADVDYARLGMMAGGPDSRHADRTEADGNRQTIDHGAL